MARLIEINEATGLYQANLSTASVALLDGDQTWNGAQTIRANGVPLTLERTTDAASNQALIVRGNNRAAAADADVAYGSFFLQNDAATPENVEAVRFEWQLTDVSDGSEDGYFGVYGMRAGSLAIIFEGGWLADASGRVILNTAQHDFDVVLHGDTNTYAFEYNAGLFLARGAYGFGAQAAVSAFLNVVPAAFTADANTSIAALRVAPTGITVPAGTTAIAASATFDEPVLTATGTITEATTVYISGVPTEGATANYALLVATGLTRLGGNLVLGTGEGGTTAPTGTTLRAPNIATGGAGNVAGADLTIAAGLGTGTGDVGTVIVQLPIVAGAGDIIQTIATRLTLDMAGSTTVLTMAAAQAMTISTAAGDLELSPSGNLVGKAGLNFYPASDNNGQIGDETNRWALIRGVTVIGGDFVFENRWRLTEAEGLGLGPGVALVRPDGSISQVFN